MAGKHESHTAEIRASLLRAVCEQPDDLRPRLRYADYLETTGDPNDAIRGEFIRIQCDLTQIDFSHDRWEQLYERQLELEQYRERWSKELPQVDGIRWNQFEVRLGFIWDVECDNEDLFRKHAAVIFASSPIQSLSLKRMRSLKTVLDISEVSRIKRLMLEELQLVAKDAQTLAESKNTSNLKALHLFGNLLADDGAKAIAESLHLRQLDNLDLGHNKIGDNGVTALAQSPVVAPLSHLGLAGNPITNAGAMALVSSPHLNQLTGLTLWECSKIGAEGRKALKARFGDTVSFED